MRWFHGFRRQLRSTTHQTASRVEQSILQEANLNSSAASLAGKGFRKGGQKAKEQWKTRETWKRTAVDNSAASRPKPVPRTADGYLRKTPVQPIYEPPGYRRRLVLRAVWIVVIIMVVLFLLNFFLHSFLRAW